MSKDKMSQEEVDALLNSNSKSKEDELDSVKSDIMGEVGNISMSTAATALSQILNHRVLITTPRVSITTLEKIAEEATIPKVITSIEFSNGLVGRNLLMMNIRDANTIAKLMMGNDDIEDSDEFEFTDLELSAVGEAMNQMIGSASTSLSTLLDKMIDISPPEVRVWSKDESLGIDEKDLKESICKISFDMSVEGYIESEIMQVFNMSIVEEIVNTMLGEAEVEEEPEKISEPEAKQVENQGTQDRKEVKVEVKEPVFPDLEIGKEEVKIPRNLDLIMDVPLEFNVVLGKSRKTIKEILSFTNGSIVELDRLADEPLEVYVNGKLIAYGEVVVINENFGVRITNILTKEERVKNLR